MLQTFKLCNAFNHRYESRSEVAQSCPTLCDPMDCSLPGSSIYGIFQARVVEWGANSFSRRSSQPRDWTLVSHIVSSWGCNWPSHQPHIWQERNCPRAHKDKTKIQKSGTVVTLCLSEDTQSCFSAFPGTSLHFSLWIVCSVCFQVLLFNFWGL